jgi:hypothetical protein
MASDIPPRIQRALGRQREATRDAREAALQDVRERHPSFTDEHADEISKVIRDELAQHRPPQPTVPEVHVHVAPTPSRPDSEPPRSLRDRLRRPSPMERLVAALVAGGAALAGALEALRVLGEAMR